MPFFIIVQIFLIIFIVLGCGTPSNGPAPAPVGTIDGEPIPREAFTNALVMEQGDAFFRRYVDRELVARAAKAANIVVSDEKIDEAVEKQAKEYFDKLEYLRMDLSEKQAAHERERNAKERLARQKQEQKDEAAAA